MVWTKIFDLKSNPNNFSEQARSTQVHKNRCKTTGWVVALRRDSGNSCDHQPNAPLSTMQTPTGRYTGIWLPDQWNNSLVFLTGEASPRLMFWEALQDPAEQLERAERSKSHLTQDPEGIICEKREWAAADAVKARRTWGECNNRLPVWRSWCKGAGTVCYSCPK